VVTVAATPPVSAWAPYDAWFPQAASYEERTHDRSYVKVIGDTSTRWYNAYGAAGAVAAVKRFLRVTRKPTANDLPVIPAEGVERG
jgi:hypothetical protein